MKKLLIAMTAAAVGTCAWADGEQTLLNETFESTWTLTDNTWWTYSAGEAADGELTLADGKLSLNTGSKVLTGSFTSDDKPKAIGTDGLYFNATVTFKDPSDTLPELKDSDKFALVVLDNVESIDAGYTTTPATNLWVIAKYGESGQRAYQLDVEVTPSWLTDEHKIVVKAYNNVMANGNCAGFLVKVDNEDNDTVCTVVQSCAIVENVIDYGTFCPGGNYFGDDGLGGSGNLGYLGYPKNAILGKRYGDSTLILSNVPSSDTLASVDFQGQGVIDDVSLATTGANFGAEAKTLMISATANGVTDIACDSNAYAETGYIIPANAETVTVTFKLASGYVLSAPAGAVKGDNDVYTYTYAVGEDINQSLTISAFAPAAYVGDTAYETFAGALAAALKDGGTLKLGGDVTAADFGNNYTYLYVETGKTLVLDLNGKTIQGSGTDDMPTPSIFNEGTLTIKDSARTGCVKSSGYGAVLNAGTLTIEAGIFDGSVTTDGGETSITGGKFLKAANASITVDTDKYVVDADTEADYYIVKDKPAAPSTFEVTYTAGNFTLTKLNGETYEAFTSGTELANGTYTFKVAAAEGYKVDSVTVGETTATVAEDGTFSVTVSGDDVAIVVTTSVKSLYPESDKLVDGEVTADVTAALGELAAELGGGDDAVTNYITQVCGGTVDAATLTAAKTAGTIGLSVDYDLPLMAAEPTVSEIEAEAAGADDAAVFSFQINVNATPIEIKQVTDKVRSMIEYGTSLNGMNALTPQDTGVELELSGSTIKVKLLKQNGVKSGFMKVKLNK